MSGQRRVSDTHLQIQRLALDIDFLELLEVVLPHLQQLLLLLF